MAQRQGSDADRALVLGVCRWFARNERELPWRRRLGSVDPGGARRDPYRSLVSEFMLQQTQVSRVLERFGPFMERFPTLAALAATHEQAVMAEWSGMGYYRRARNLHAAAKEIAARFGGVVPRTVPELRTLPGVGRYTAGAIASIVFGLAEPIVDGNVARVLMRVGGKELTAAEGSAWAWGRAEALVAASAGPFRGAGGRDVSPAAFNEGLMELGAVVCTPRGPRCGECPLRGMCRAFEQGRVDRIPRASRATVRKPLYCAAVVVADGRGRVLMEQRPDAGMWGGLWQAPTLEGRRRATRAGIEAWIGLRGLVRIGRFDHGTTHRDVKFEVWRGAGPLRRPGAVWMARSRIAGLPLSNAQRRVLLGVAAGGGAK